jgi:hypothetical protein
MSAVLQEKYRNEPSFEEVLAQHPGFPRLIALKIDVQRRGVFYTDRALANTDPEKHQLLQAKQLFGYRDNTPRRIPQSLLLRDGTSLIVDPTPLAHDPYLIDFIDGQFVIVDEGRVIETVEPWLRPAYYGKLSASGIPLEDLVSARPQRLSVIQSKYCYFGVENNECKYCDVNASKKESSELSGITRKQRLEELRDAIGEALKEPGRFTGICITGGSVLKGDEVFDLEVKLYIETLQAIGENFKTKKFTSQLVASAFNEKQLARLYEKTGLTSYTTDLEVLNEELFDWICPGKTKAVGGYKEWRRRLIGAVDIFGRGHVNTGIVGGIEMAQPNGFKSEVDGLKSTLDEAEFLAEHGVSAIHCVWQPRPGSFFKSQRSPSLNYYLGLAQGLQEIRVRHGLDIYFDDYRRCGNHPDTDLARLYS